MSKFSANPILFKINNINRDRFETAHSASSVLGSAFHNAMNVYYGGSDEIVVTNEQDAIQKGMQAGMDFIDKYEDGFIAYNKSSLTCKQDIFDKFSFCFNSYISETPYVPDQVISVEEELESLIDVEWKGKELQLPVKLKGRVDRIVKIKGKKKVIDYKTCYSFSDPDKIDGNKILQAVTYYLLEYAKTGEAPYSVIFEEVKSSKNKDGSSQVRRYEMVLGENSLYFDLFFRFYEDMVRALNGEQVYVPNFNALYDNEVAVVAYIHRLDETEELAKKMKEHKVHNVTELLQKEIQNAAKLNTFMKTVETEFKSAKNLDYDSMKSEEKIQTKMMEHGMMIQFAGIIEGASVDLYQFTPSIGLKMSRIRSYVDDVEQVLGVSGIRVLAPIPNSTMIGFEVPRSERTFPDVPEGSDFEVGIGQDVYGAVRRFDIRTAPHMLVAGASGSGKSVFLNSLITQLLRIPNADLHLYDPKMVELKQFQDQVAEYADTPEGIMQGLISLEEEMDTRYVHMKEKGARNASETDMKYKFVVIDEFGDFIMTAKEVQKSHTAGGYYSKSKPWLLKEAARRATKEGKIAVPDLTGDIDMVQISERATKDEIAAILELNDQLNPLVGIDVESTLIRLAQKARACGIHMIIATQSPRADVISGNIKSNFPTKAVFRTSKEIESRIVFDDSGAEKLRGKGDMLFVSNDGVERLQGFNI